MKKAIGIIFLMLCPAWLQATSPEDYYNAGMDLMKQKDYEKAVHYFHAAVDQRPDYWQAYQFLGEAYYQAANRTEAVVAMRESLRLHSHNPELRKFMERIEKDSPWVPSDSLWEKGAVILSLIFSSLSLWMLFYGPHRLRSRGNPPPNKP